MQRLTLQDLQATMDKEVINGLPLGRYEGAIHLIDNSKSLRLALKDLKGESLVGFDTESRPSFHKGESYPPSLIQIGAKKAVYLFQISVIKDVQPIFEFLSNPHILKVGIAIREDIRRLQADYVFEPGGFVEIGRIAKQLGMKYSGLRTLAAIVMGFRISKKAQISNWAQRRLTEVQINYAATDAWISRELYLRLSAALAEHPELTPKGTKSKVC